MQVHFITPTKISFLDISSMGDSSKRGDSTKIGTFDSGFKYSIALLMRDLVDINISVRDNYELKEFFTFGTENVHDSSTGKSKELITITDIFGKTAVTGFAKALGFNWEIWMALRELWSNMLDENGYVIEGELLEDIEYGTVITLDFNSSSEFYNVWQNKHLYINNKEPLFDLGTVKVLDNPDKVLRIYKNNILVYEDLSTSSQFSYNLSFGEIDERRILSNVSSVKDEIARKFALTDNEDFARTFIKQDFNVSKEDFLYNPYLYSSYVSDTVNKVATEIYEEFGEVDSYDWIMTRVRRRKDCKINGKVIKTVEDSLWSYSSDVHVESAPIKIEKSFSEKVKDIYNFNVDVEVKTAKLRGSKVVADKFENCIIVSEDFNLDTDFHTFLVEYFTLTQEGNIIVNLSKYICNLIKK